MIRVVIDTNVFVSSFFGGNPRKIIDLWKNGSIVLCLSQEIIEEYLAVLNRLGLDNTKEISNLTRLFAEGYNSIFTAKTFKLEVVKEEVEDQGTKDELAEFVKEFQADVESPQQTEADDETVPLREQDTTEALVEKDKELIKAANKPAIAKPFRPGDLRNMIAKAAEALGFKEKIVTSQKVGANPLV